jgi:hypothetical protein
MTAATVKLIDIGWRQYAERLLPPNAPRVQLWECRRAYYAGAAYLFTELTARIGPDSASEDAGLALLTSVSDEIDAFLRDVQRGKR